jgi:hypothetical protein
VAVKLSLPHLFDEVVARFAAEGPWLTPPVVSPPAPGVPVPNLFGWRTKGQQLTTGVRILWIPGDDGSGSAGAVKAARSPGGNPRPLHTLAELCTVYITAHDKTAPENERKQYDATRLLYDAWLRAIYLAAFGTYSIVSTTWVTEKLERRHGAALRVVLAVEAVVPDVVQAMAPLDTFVDVTVEINSNGDETFAGEVLTTEEEAT